MSLAARVAAAMERLAPLALADHSWDNVGLLVEAPPAWRRGPPQTQSENAPPPSAVAVEESCLPLQTVLLTIDLSAAVLAECVARGATVVVAYHPVIFRPLKRIALDDPGQRIVAHCLREGISVYCPHTALDAARGGMNDWLARVAAVGISDDGGPSAESAAPIVPDAKFPECGMGRVAMLQPGPMSVRAFADRVKTALRLPSVRVALPEGWTRESLVRRVAVCAGSGAGVFRRLDKFKSSGSDVDVLLTGEMGHHEVLAAVAASRAVVLCEHTNAERGYLSAVLGSRLSRELRGVEIAIAQADADPISTW